MNNFPKPINENVIVQVDEAQKKEYAKGIVVPDDIEDAPRTGIVKAASEGYYAKESGVFIPLDVKKNDKVLFRNFGGDKITFDGIAYLLMKQSDILLIF